MDEAWDDLGDAVLRPVLGDLADSLAKIQDRKNRGQSTGWYGYVDKDLRTLLGREVRGRFALRYCGRGSLSRCRAALWGALRRATARLSGEQGADPAAWRADADKRIEFVPGLIRNTMRWTNRPTFQQVLRFARR